jgi:hypothetical protein
VSTSLLPFPSFETLARLAHDDPRAFEALRRELVEDFISHAPARHERRLRGLQFRIDGVRSLARSDYGAALRVFNLMWERFESLAALWRDLPAELAPRRGASADPGGCAEVIALADRRRPTA